MCVLIFIESEKYILDHTKYAQVSGECKSLSLFEKCNARE